MKTRLWGSGLACLLLAVVAAMAWRHVTGPAPSDDTTIALPVPPVPPRIADGPEYAHCLDILANDPAGAAAYSDSWLAQLGADAPERLGALHCQALAQVGLGQPDLGAAALEELAQGDAPALARIVLLGQAAHVWLMLERPERAFAAGAAALALAPDDADLLVAHAQAAIQLNRAKDAAADLDRALLADPRRVDALVLRARIRREGQPPQGANVAAARVDVERALQIDPDNAEALLERGILRQLSGDSVGAHADWQRSLSLAPDGPAADLARQNLALLEAGPEQR